MIVFAVEESYFAHNDVDRKKKRNDDPKLLLCVIVFAVEESIVCDCVRC